jgi:hypothetical protein
MTVKCPGQDQRFWEPEDIFEAACPNCGDSIEFWKDEPQAKCPACHEVIPNPKLDMGCAKWCKFADECLGRNASEQSKVLCNKLIADLRELAGGDKGYISSCLNVLKHAQKIQLNEGGDPLVVKATAVFCQIGRLDGQSGDTGLTAVRGILGKHVVGDELIEEVCVIIKALESGQTVDSLEFSIISDAILLAKTSVKGEDVQFVTETAKRIYNAC